MVRVTAPGEDHADGPARLLIPRTAIARSDHGPLKARVARCQFQGDRYLLHLDFGEGDRSLVCPSDSPVAQGEMISLALNATRLRLFAHA